MRDTLVNHSPMHSRISRGRAMQAALLGALLAAASAPCAAQAPSSSRPALTIPRVERAPTLEDFLEMRPNAAVEGRLAKAEGFIQQTPSDGKPSTQRTEVYLGY